LEEAEEYKEARLLLDSVKLEPWTFYTVFSALNSGAHFTSHCF
jgi:hypothetical protein